MDARLARQTRLAMQTRLSIAAIGLIFGLAGFHGGATAQAQGTQTAASGQGEATGSCSITSRGNQKVICANRVPQAACAANAREQRTTFEWKAGAECP